MEERQKAIVELLHKNDKLTVPELCKLFSVSPATIRADLRELAALGLVQRTHGGAIRNSSPGYELNTEQKSVKNLEQKKLIAAKALELIEDYDTIALDTGTTTLELAKMLGEKNGLTVVVNDIDIARMLEDNTNSNIILTGGVIRRGFHCTIGSSAVGMLTDLRVKKAFIACNGISAQYGITTPDINQAEVKRALCKMAEDIYVLCDSSKFGRTTLAHILPAAEVDAIITDSAEISEELDELRILGINIVTV